MLVFSIIRGHSWIRSSENRKRRSRWVARKQDIAMGAAGWPQLNSKSTLACDFLHTADLPSLAKEHKLEFISRSLPFPHTAHTHNTHTHTHARTHTQPHNHTHTNTSFRQGPPFLSFKEMKEPETRQSQHEHILTLYIHLSENGSSVLQDHSNAISVSDHFPKLDPVPTPHLTAPAQTHLQLLDAIPHRTSANSLAAT